MNNKNICVRILKRLRGKLPYEKQRRRENRLNKLLKNVGIYIIIFALVLGLAYYYQGIPAREEVKEISFSEFVSELEHSEITKMNLTDKTITGQLRDKTNFIAYVPSSVDWNVISQKYVMPQVENGTIEEYTSDAPVVTPWYISIIPTVLMMVALFAFWYFMLNRAGGGGNVMNFGRSRGRMVKEGDMPKVTFDDVAGLDEEKKELEEIVDFLRNPKKYHELGARIPKGMLLVGPPGTGKTYISKATAGEAHVPFFSISGSDFVEMFVGVGASRVRDLFDQAKKNSPCIIFIDEIDAVGRRRGAGLGGGHDEREQTLNQLLVEMDGFGENTGIIILAATNRPDILDPALLRPGRFDRQIVIGTPDVKGREAIIKVHSKNKPLDTDVDPKVLARRTPGFTPADIENVLNEAALLTARRNGRSIRMEEIEEAITKVLAGPEKRSRVITEEERKLTAFHEAGHAVVDRTLPDADPVHQITIIPRGRAGGFTMSLPKEEKYYATRRSMKNDIIGLLGGRVAEKLTLDDISTGASNDIQRATEIARNMITKYGFSEKLGPVNYSSDEEVFLGRDFSTRQNYSDETAAAIDEEIKRILEDCFSEAERILTENMDKLKRVAEALLELETLDGEQFERLYTGEIDAAGLAEEVRKAEEEKQRINAEQAAETERLLQEEKRKMEEARRQNDRRSGPALFPWQEGYEEDEGEELGEDSPYDGDGRGDAGDSEN